VNGRVVGRSVFDGIHSVLAPSVAIVIVIFVVIVRCHLGRSNLVPVFGRSSSVVLVATNSGM
jgi:hypothetical protein